MKQLICCSNTGSFISSFTITY